MTRISVLRRAISVLSSHETPTNAKLAVLTYIISTMNAQTCANAVHEALRRNPDTHYWMFT